MYIIIKPNILVCIRYMHKIVCWSPIGISWGELGIRGYPIPRCKYDLKARLPLERKLFGKYDMYDLYSFVMTSFGDPALFSPALGSGSQLLGAYL